jgi:hypothetical protein
VFFQLFRWRFVIGSWNRRHKLLLFTHEGIQKVYSVWFLARRFGANAVDLNFAYLLLPSCMFSYVELQLNGS